MSDTGLRLFLDSADPARDTVCLDGSRVDPLLATLHAVLFWFIHSIAVVLPLFVTFFSSKKRLLHDILLGTFVSKA